jgi:nitroreductase
LLWISQLEGDYREPRKRRYCLLRFTGGRRRSAFGVRVLVSRLLEELVLPQIAQFFVHVVVDTMSERMPMLNDRSSLSAFYATRRSGKPRDMVEPGPDAAELQRILIAAIRVPDHGKLAPWRFVVVAPEQRDAFADLLHRAYCARRPEPGREKIAAIDAFARQAPTLVVAVSTPDATSKIPRWEQQLSAGAACMNLLAAASAQGFVGSWLTGWAAYSATVRAAFAPEGRIAGFIFIGTPSRELQERPRPDYDAVVSEWQP